MNNIARAFWMLIPLSLTACNMYGGIDHPGDDNQYLSAARGCLDRGDYDCASQNYQKLSNSYNDVKYSEEGLNTLAQSSIFSISDLVSALGTDLGSAASFSILARLMASRGITGGAQRSTIMTVYLNDANISNTHLKAFSKFLAALAMFNEVLANAVGSDGVLTASDLVLTPSGCSTNNTNVAACGPPVGTSLTYSSSPSSEPTMTSGSASDWAGSATIQKLVNAAVEAVAEFTAIGGSTTDQNLLNSLQAITSINAGTFNTQVEREARAQLVSALQLQ